MNTATTILNQLGGNRFLMFTGSKIANYSNNNVVIKLSRNNSKAQFLKVELNSNDTYTMQFFSIDSKTLNTKVKHNFTDVYCDQLVSIFENTTELYTKLF